MAEIVKNPTPQQRFQQDNKKVSEHRDMVGSKAFEIGSDVAMLEYSRLLAVKSIDGNSAVWVGMKLQGAFEFLQTFRMLAESPTPRRAEPIPQNLKDDN